MAKIDTNQINEVSRISLGTEVTGTFVSQSDIRIDGTFDGEIKLRGKIVVGENGVIKGKVECDNMDVWGKIEGDVIVNGLISLKNCSSLSGNLKAQCIGIEAGAVFNGTCEILEKKELKQDKK